MVGILLGIGQAIGSLFGVEPKPIDEKWEEQINKILAEEREKIRPSREDIDTFSWITGDNNPIHRLPKRAQELGFSDIPLMGAHVAAYGEQFIERVVERMRNYWGADIKITGQDSRFKSALHPGEKTLWQVTGYKQNNGIELNVTGSTKDRKIIDITSRLGVEYPHMPQIAGPIPNSSRRFLLDQNHLEEFYDCVGAKNTGQVPHMLPAAYVPATLLRLLEERTQSMEGANLSMKYDFLARAKTGTLQVDIFPPREPSERKGKFIYKFRTVVSQDTCPITYGEIVSSTRQRIPIN